ELPEFSRSVLEALRQPLEDRVITLARAKQSVQYPATFLLIATANPCPCGYYGTGQICNCTPALLSHYQQKISGPILDRFDLHVAVQSVEVEGILALPRPSTESVPNALAENARKNQFKRYKSHTILNSTIDHAKIVSGILCISNEATELLNRAARNLHLSARAYMRVLKVSRTIADLENSPAVLPAHLAEALQYRPVRKQ
ncbi:MAG TPA: ATP-binding protein, partial [Ktedonobacteraceae bacterium]|nr:ATP-binding protein [Ktedonobacteraceae bacterium]